MVIHSQMSSQTRTLLTNNLDKQDQPNVTSQLPLEIFVHIFSFLKDSDLQEAISVDQRWKTVALTAANHHANKKIAKIIEFARMLGENFSDPTQKEKFLLETPIDYPTLKEIKQGKRNQEDEKIKYLLSTLTDLNNDKLDQLYIAVYDKLERFEQEFENGFFENLFVIAKCNKKWDRVDLINSEIEEKDLSLPVSPEVNYGNQIIEDKLPSYFHRFAFETLCKKIFKLILSEAMKDMSKEKALQMLASEEENNGDSPVILLSKETKKEIFTIQQELRKKLVQHRT